MNDDEEIGVDMGPATEPHSKREIELARENDRLRGIIERVKSVFGEQYAALRSLFENKPTPSPEPFPPESFVSPVTLAMSATRASERQKLFLSKAGNGVRGKMLRAMIEHRTLSKKQLATIADTKLSSSSFKDSLSWLRSNGLVDVSGDYVQLESR